METAVVGSGDAQATELSDAGEETQEDNLMIITVNTRTCELKELLGDGDVTVTLSLPD